MTRQAVPQAAGQKKTKLFFGWAASTQTRNTF